MSALAWTASGFSLMRLKSMAAFHASVAGAASALALAATSGSLTAAEAQKSLARVSVARCGKIWCARVSVVPWYYM